MERREGGSVSNLRVRVIQHELGNTSVTLMKNGSATSLTVAFSESDSFPATFEDATHSVSFSATDTLAWLIEFADSTHGDETTMTYISAKVVFD